MTSRYLFIAALFPALAAHGGVETTTRVTVNLLRDGTPIETISAADSETAWRECEKRALLLAGKEAKTSGQLQFPCQNEKRIVTATYSAARLLFRSGFEGTTAIQPITDCWGTGCWQDIAGVDGAFTWPPMGGKFLLLSDPVQTTAASIGARMFNRIQTNSMRQSHVLFQQISVNVNGTGPMGSSSEQNEFQFLPKQDPGDLYVSYWLSLQADLVQKMSGLPPAPGVINGGTWRGIFAFKTGGQTPWGTPANDGDYRVEAYVSTSGGGKPYWAILGDNNAGGGAPLVNNWYIENRAVPVPVGPWFKVEFFWHRSAGNDGRMWFAADGQVIADRRGPNLGAWSLPVNRIIAPLLYSGSAMPIYQWVDDVEVWDGFPPVGANPPYAQH